MATLPAARDPVRVRTRARRAAPRRRRSPTTRSRASSRASASRSTRDGADFVVTPPSLPLRPRDRGRPDRGSRAHPRLRHDPGDAARARAAHAAARPRRGAASSAASSARSPTATGRRSSRSASSSSASGARCSIRHAASRSRVLNPIASAARRDAHVAAAGPGRDAADQPQPQGVARARVRDSAACSARDGGRLRAAAAHRRPGVSARRCRSSGASRARDVDFFDVKGDLEALAAPRRVDDRGRGASGAASRALGARR